MQLEWRSATELAGLPGLEVDERNVRMRASNEGWRFRVERSEAGRSMKLYNPEDLPPKTQAWLHVQAAKVHTFPTPQPPAPKSDVDPRSESLWRRWVYSANDADRAKAAERQRMVNTVRKLIKADVGKMEAYQTVADLNGVSVRVLRRWCSIADKEHRCDVAPALLPGKAKGRPRVEISPEAWEWLKAEYLSETQPSFAQAYELTKRMAKKKGWILPSERTCKRWMKSDVPHAVRVLARQGEEALEQLFPPLVRDRSQFHAMEAVNADGHKFDVFVRWPDGEVGRPIMVAWQDLYSGRILSWRFGKVENSDLVRLSARDMVAKYGIPDHAYLDNGRGFASKWITGGVSNRYRFKVKEEEPHGILHQMGCEIHWTTPYHGQSKPIERAFRDLASWISRNPRFSGAYTGNNPTAKPENYGTRAVDFEQFRGIAEEEIRAHNAREGRRTFVCQGRSFEDVFNESFANSVVRKPTELQLHSLLLAAESVRLDRKTGAFSLVDPRNRHWCPELTKRGGEKVVVRFDPENLHGDVWVYDLQGEFIARAECRQAGGFADTDRAKSHNRERNRYKRAAKEQREAQIRIDILEAERGPVPDEVLPDPPNVVAAEFGRSGPEDLGRRRGSEDDDVEEIDVDATLAKVFSMYR